MSEYLASAHSEGARFVLVEQSMREQDMVFFHNLMEDTKAPWAHGLYELNQDGTLGKCLHFNFDSSD
jgi:hypothetical protein